jgi:cystathionine gamma-synthase
MHPETIAVRGGIEHHPGDEVAPPIHLSTTFVQPDVVPPGQFSYARGGSPGYQPLERALAGIEEAADAVVFNAGAAAFVALAEEARPGTAVVFPEDAYFGFRVWMENNAARFGWELRLVRQQDLDGLARALDGASLMWAETPTNPTMGIADLAAIGNLCAERGVPWVCDNTFASPVLQRPLAFGAIASMHSVTKYIAGHSDVILGTAIVNDPDLADRLRTRRSSNGTQPDGFGCWLARRGMQTLPLRVKQQAATAMELATRLQSHPKVTTVHYPGLPDAPGHEVAVRQMRGAYGGMLSIVLAGGEPEAVALPGRCRVWVPATSLGGVESLIERRARWSGEASDPALLRLSCGIEHVEDLWEDLEQALG